MSGWLTRRNLLALVVALAALVALIYPLFRHMAIKGLQAEAHLMLSYIHSLESAYHIDNSQYVYFDAFYGSPIDGRENCMQPAGAERLGFLVRWCHKAGATPVRYAYRVTPGVGGDHFQAEAHSGSDTEDQSFICFGLHEDDVWQMDEKRVLKRTRACD